MGAPAVGLLWDGEPGRLTLARRASRPLCLGHGDGFVLFASTAEPLELAARATGRKLRIEEIAEGRALELREGRVESRRRFHVDRRYVGQPLVTYPPLAEKPALLRLALAAF